jgi:hypothetical protein
LRSLIPLLAKASASFDLRVLREQSITVLPPFRWNSPAMWFLSSTLDTSHGSAIWSWKIHPESRWRLVIRTAPEAARLVGLTLRLVRPRPSQRLGENQSTPSTTISVLTSVCGDSSSFRPILTPWGVGVGTGVAGGLSPGLQGQVRGLLESPVWSWWPLEMR